MNKMNRFLRVMIAIGVISSVGLAVSCDDDDAPGALTVQSITASGTSLETGEPVTDIDLFGATAADDVPLDATIEVTFNKNVDAATVSASSVTLTGGDAPPAVTTAVSDNVVTVTFGSELERGTDYTLTVTGVKATDGGLMTAASSITFGSAGRGEVTPPQEAAQQIYLNLDGTSEDQMGNYSVANEAAIEYGEDRFGLAGSAAWFDGDASIIEYADGANLLSQNMTMSFWIYVDTVDHFNADGNLANMFAVGIGNFNGFQIELGRDKYNRMLIPQTLTGTDPTRPTAAEEFTIFDLNGTLEDFEVNRGADFENTVAGGLQGLTIGKWAHFVYVYNSAENKRYFYINGTLQRSDAMETSTLPHIQNFNSLTLSRNETQDEESDVEFISTRLALGFVHGTDSKMWATQPWGGYTFPHANHFKGGMDDFRVFNAPLSAEEVAALYDAEKP